MKRTLFLAIHFILYAGSLNCMESSTVSPGELGLEMGKHYVATGQTKKALEKFLQAIESGDENVRKEACSCIRFLIPAIFKHPNSLPSKSRSDEPDDELIGKIEQEMEKVRKELETASNLSEEMKFQQQRVQYLREDIRIRVAAQIKIVLMDAENKIKTAQQKLQKLEEEKKALSKKH
jgi:hypothetical protein